jgi:hypothetical protein
MLVGHQFHRVGDRQGAYVVLGQFGGDNDDGPGWILERLLDGGRRDRVWVSIEDIADPTKWTPHRP